MIIKFDRVRHPLGNYYYDNYKRIHRSNRYPKVIAIRCSDTQELILAALEGGIVYKDRPNFYSRNFVIDEEEKLSIATIEEIYELEHQGEYYKGNYWLHSSNNYLTVDRLEKLNEVNFIFTKNTKDEEEYELVFYKLTDNRKGTVNDVVRKKYKLKEVDFLKEKDIWTLVYTY